MDMKKRLFWMITAVVIIVALAVVCAIHLFAFHFGTL
jgi:hypothetical protein